MVPCLVCGPVAKNLLVILVEVVWLTSFSAWQVLSWMEDTGVQPSLEMYRSILPYACRDGSCNYGIIIREKIGEHLQKKKEAYWAVFCLYNVIMQINM